MLYTNPIDAATFKSVRAAHDAGSDTNPNSAFWANAPSVFLDADNYGHPVPWLRTTVRSRWTNENLYIFFACPYRELHLKPSPNTLEETHGLWNWDVAEMFLGSDFENIDHYKEFEISPQGEWLDLDIHLNDPRRERRALHSGFQVAARIDRNKKIWYGVMRIPFAAIDSKAPHAGQRFRVNLFRSQGPAPETKLLAWQAPMSDTFHKPERFGTLELIDK